MAGALALVGAHPGLATAVVETKRASSLGGGKLVPRATLPQGNPHPTYADRCPRFLAGRTHLEFLQWRTASTAKGFRWPS